MTPAPSTPAPDAFTHDNQCEHVAGCCKCYERTYARQAATIATLTAEKGYDAETIRHLTLQFVETLDERDAAREVINRAARIMRGEGVNDQAEAWDQTLKLLDAARSVK